MGGLYAGKVLGDGSCDVAILEAGTQKRVKLVVVGRHVYGPFDVMSCLDLA